MYSFSAEVSCSSSLLVTLRSAARTMPSVARMPIAVPAREMASSAYSTWYNRPSGEKMVVWELVQQNAQQSRAPSLPVSRISSTWRRWFWEGIREGLKERRRELVWRRMVLSAQLNPQASRTPLARRQTKRASDAKSWGMPVRIGPDWAPGCRPLNANEIHTCRLPGLKSPMLRQGFLIREFSSYLIQDRSK